MADLEAYVKTVHVHQTSRRRLQFWPGHNAWQMTATALVLFMTLPGLALFYRWLGTFQERPFHPGHVHGHHRSGDAALVPRWLQPRFQRQQPVLRRPQPGFFNGIKPGAVGAGYYWISDSVWAMFQLTFAIITPALIFGATAERMKFISVLVFTAIWMFAVYFPLAHMVWSVKGFMCGTLNPDAGIKAIDFAGGTVVHMSSGWSASSSV